MVEDITAITKEWTKQRKAEERRVGRTVRRVRALARSSRVTIKEIAWEVMAAAYAKTSNDGQYPAHARQVMYVARREIQSRKDQMLDDQYFCQTLLPDYLKEHPAETATWDVVFDARGNFVEPHTGRPVPLGTLNVRQYLQEVDGRAIGPVDDEVLASAIVPGLFPTRGPGHRFGAILFIEKEGFLPLFRAVRLADRYDIAIMSTKGLSTTASRLLVDRLCAGFEIPLLVLHDFDKSGFAILGTLRRDTRRYSFENKIRVLDLGLRLKDVREWGLDSELVAYGKSDPRRNLYENGADEEETQFLHAGTRPPHGHYGRRVELNAFTSGDIVAFVEGKLEENGIRKVIPGDDVLSLQYRRVLEARIFQSRAGEVAQRAREEAQRADVPQGLFERVRQRLQREPAMSWDQAVEAEVIDETNPLRSGRDGPLSS
jgi:hypothetical protein